MATPLSTFYVTPTNRLWLASGVGTLVTLIYTAAGRLSLQLSPRTLPFGTLDNLVPFLPWTIWVYVSVNAIYIVSCLLQRDLERMRVFLLTYLFAYLVSGVFFLIHPTTFPREMFVVDPDSGLSARALVTFRRIDQPTNCLPSMHVASVVLCTLPFYRTRPRLFICFCLWSVLISASTLTTKQHYFVDLVWGALFGLLCHALISAVSKKSRSKGFVYG